MVVAPQMAAAAQVAVQGWKGPRGYLMNDDILLQATKAMDILQEHYPSEKHVLF